MQNVVKLIPELELRSRVLVVEDEPTNMAILTAYLQQAGYAVTQAVDGQLAWQELQRNPNYDLVVADRNMPNMDGLELSARIKNTAHLKHVPVIMQTSMSSPEHVVEGIKAGVFYYLTKPYEQNVLLTIVNQALRMRDQGVLFEERLIRQNQALSYFIKGEIQLRHPQEAENIALMLGSLFKQSEQAVNGLFELILNAIEHGNAGIGFEAKAQLLATRQWEAELDRRLSLPEHGHKKVTVGFTHDKDTMQVTIMDEGQGFDWRPYLQIEPARATQSNGRGIAKANLLGFDSVKYYAPGNQVTVTGKAR